MQAQAQLGTRTFSRRVSAVFARPAVWRVASRTVVMLGITSMLTDISSEMVSTVLPLYFVLYLHVSPLQFGLVDGMYQGATAVVQLAAGVLADRWRRYREIAGIGYVLSALARLGLLVVGAAPGPIAGLVFVDRTGKGVRTAPRDALISLSSPRAQLGQAFGVHRTLDTLGSLVGPLIAFALLSAVPGDFNFIFIVSLAFAAMGVAALFLLVDNLKPGAVPARRQPASLRSAVRLLRTPGFGMLVLAAIGLSVFTISDAFVFLTLQHEVNLPIGAFPLLYAAASVLFLVLAIPVGRLADRVGRARVFLVGYALLAGCIGVLLVPIPAAARVVVAVVCLGCFSAATDGVLMALVSGIVPPHQRTSGLALLASGSSLGLFLSSVMFGALWASAGVSTALLGFGGGLVLATAFAATVFSRSGLMRTTRSLPGREARSGLRHRGCTGCPLSELEHTCPGKADPEPTHT